MGDLPRYEEIKKVLLRGIGILGKMFYATWR